MTDITTRLAAADAVAEALNTEGYQARSWASDTSDEKAKVRVYVTRTLSRGRRQEMGYIEICRDGEINANGMDRAKAGVRDIAIAAVAS